MAAVAARSWTEFATALRDHPTARDFVPVAACDSGGTVSIFPVLRARWADHHRVPRKPQRCAAYLERALALLDRHWPLEAGEVPDAKAACDGALRFVIYFAERDIPLEREHEFLLAGPLNQLVRTLADEAWKRKFRWDLPFHYAREVTAKRMREIGARQPFVLRQVLRALQRTEPNVKDAFRLHLSLHDADLVLSACDRALVPLRVLTTGGPDGTGFRETTVRVAWPGLLEANGRLHLPFRDKPWYTAQSGSILPFARPSTSVAVGDASERARVAHFNIAALEAVCLTEDLMREATAHHAPPLHLVALPAPLSLVERLLDGILPPSPHEEGAMSLEEEPFDFGTL